MKKTIILAFLFLILLSGCIGQPAHQELTDSEIKSILADVISNEQLVDEAGLRYFQELSSENNNILQPAAVNEMLTRNEPIFILDIRREEDHKLNHIRTANNIWWFDVGVNLDKIPKDQKIIAVCYSGQAAGQVTGVLRVLGYDVSSIAGGMNGWLAAELPTTQ